MSDMDTFIGQQTGRQMMDTASGSMDLVDHGMVNSVRRFFGGGGDKPLAQLGKPHRGTADLLKEGMKAKPVEETIAPADAEDMVNTVDNIMLEGETPPDIPPEGAAAPESPLEPPPEITGTPEEQAAKMAQAQQEELQRRTWERNINLDYIDQPEEIGGILEYNARLLDEADHESLSAIEGDVEGSVAEIMRPVLSGEQNGNLTSRQMLAGRRMLMTMLDEVNRLKDKILDDTASTEDKLSFEKMQGQSVMLQRFMQGKIRETARTLNSMKITASVMKSGDLEAMAKMSAGDSVVMKARILKERQDAGDDIADTLQAMDEMGRLGKSVSSIISYWTASILSGFKTQLLNVTSNTTMQMVNTLGVRATAAGISPLRRRLTGDTVGVEGAEVLAELIASRQGLRDAFLMSGRVFMKGTFENQGEYVSSFAGRKKTDDITPDTMMLSEVAGVDRIPVLSHLMDLVQRSTEAASYGGLTTGDEFFKAMAYRKSLYGQAVRKAAAEGLEGDALGARANELLDNIDINMHKEALSEAERLTFTNEIGGFIGMMADDVAKWTTAVPVMKFVAPFIHTPTALVDRTIKMSPFAPLQKEFRQRLARGGADADVALAELLFGSTMMGLFTLLYQQGVITGGGPANYAQRDALDALGWQRYSVRFGEHTLVSFQRGLDPLGMSLGAIAGMLDKMSYSKDDPSISDWTLGLGLSLAKYFKEQPYLQGLADTMALVDGKRPLDKSTARTLASFVPSLWRDVESVRRGITGKDEQPRIYPGSDFWAMLNGYLDQRLPGNIGDEPPPLRYWDGTVVTAGGGEALYLYNSLSPIRVSIGREDVASERMVANGVSVTPPSPSISIAPKMRVKVNLLKDLDGGEQLYDKLLEFVGKRRRIYMDMRVKDKNFLKLDSGPGYDQAAVLEQTLAKGLRDGRIEFFEWLMKQKPTTDQYGPSAILFNKRGLKGLVNRMKRGVLTDDETLILRDAGTRGVGTRGELYVPDI